MRLRTPVLKGTTQSYLEHRHNHSSTPTCHVWSNVYFCIYYTDIKKKQTGRGDKESNTPMILTCSARNSSNWLASVVWAAMNLNRRGQLSLVGSCYIVHASTQPAACVGLQFAGDTPMLCSLKHLHCVSVNVLMRTMFLLSNAFLLQANWKDFCQSCRVNVRLKLAAC